MQGVLETSKRSSQLKQTHEGSTKINETRYNLTSREKIGDMPKLEERIADNERPNKQTTSRGLTNHDLVPSLLGLGQPNRWWPGLDRPEADLLLYLIYPTSYPVLFYHRVQFCWSTSKHELTPKYRCQKTLNPHKRESLKVLAIVGKLVQDK